MTPFEILAEARSRFITLYHKDQAALERLLDQALGKFQDKAGAILEIWSDDPVFVAPPLFRAPANCCDRQKRYIPFFMERNEDGARIIRLKLLSRHQAPYCLYYFCDLRKWNKNEDLPGDCAALICDYLEALIAVYNTKREREAYLQAGMNESAQTLLSEQELRQRLTELEQEMEAAKAVIPPASMF